MYVSADAFKTWALDILLWVKIIPKLIDLINKTLFFQVNEDFQNDVKNLPNTLDNKQPFMNFIDRYGTHYTSKLVMGAKAITLNEVSHRLLTCGFYYKHIHGHLSLVMGKCP
jgi:hypothetical protein